MKYSIITIFPEIFSTFLDTSLIGKGVASWRITVACINPRDFCTDTHKQIDDLPYWWWAGMLLKAQPIIDAIRFVISWTDSESLTCVRLLWPTKEIFDQKDAHDVVDAYDHCILICGRYEGIDQRVQTRCEKQFANDFSLLSLWKFVTLGGEVPAMTFIEATARLIPWVIKEEMSRQDESYRPELWGMNIEYPQYTRPEVVEWMQVPEILFSWHHAHIAQRREDMMW